MLKFITIFIPLVALGVANYFSLKDFLNVKAEYKEDFEFLDLKFSSALTFMIDIVGVVLVWIILTGTAWGK